jgi:hypothetical protein
MTPSLNINSSNLRAMIAPAIAVIAILMSISPIFGGTWLAATTSGLPASVTALCNPLLLTNGTVLVHDCGNPFLTSNWYILTPDKNGRYVTGTWSATGSLPSGYGPEWFASAVLPNGKVIAIGGEYNITCPGGGTGGRNWTNLGALYDPITQVWSPQSPPSGTGWTYTGPCPAPTGSVEYSGGVGDAPSIVLPDGRFLLGSCCASPAVNALFDWKTLAWSTTGTPINACQAPAAAAGWCIVNKPFQEEQGYTLLQNGKILTISVWNPPNAEVYDPASGTWSAIAATPVSLPDPVQCGTYEIGPALGRPDGTVVAFSGHTGCTAMPNSPTAIYHPKADKWKTGPDVPAICATATTPALCTLADAPAALLPNGNILFAASSVCCNSLPLGGPTHFFEFTSATSAKPNTIEKEADPSTASFTAAGYYNLLVLPNGEILATDFTNVVKIYKPSEGVGDSDWEPMITSAPDCVAPGVTYNLSGVQLNGLSQGVAYGDDVQAATNYPLVRIVNNSTKHEFYGRTFDFSTMSIAPGKFGSTHFMVASDTEVGLSKLYVIANGIHSAPNDVRVASTVDQCMPPPLPRPRCGPTANGFNTCE